MDSGEQMPSRGPGRPSTRGGFRPKTYNTQKNAQQQHEKLLNKKQQKSQQQQHQNVANFPNNSNTNNGGVNALQQQQPQPSTSQLSQQPYAPTSFGEMPSMNSNQITMDKFVNKNFPHYPANPPIPSSSSAQQQHTFAHRHQNLTALLTSKEPLGALPSADVKMSATATSLAAAAGGMGPPLLPTPTSADYPNAAAMMGFYPSTSYPAPFDLPPSVLPPPPQAMPRADEIPPPDFLLGGADDFGVYYPRQPPLPPPPQMPQSSSSAAVAAMGGGPMIAPPFDDFSANSVCDVEPFKPDLNTFALDSLRMDANFKVPQNRGGGALGVGGGEFAALPLATNAEMRRFVLPRYITGVAELHRSPILPPISQKPLPVNWCKINYYEYDKKVGESFQVPSTKADVFVDGGFDSAGPDRFCIGAMTNLERTAECENCRRNVGRGVMLTLKGEGDVWLTVLSHHSVFVQSRLLDIQAFRCANAASSESGAEPFSDPHECRQYSTVKVFDLKQCYNDLCELNTKRMLGQKLMDMSIEEREREVTTRGMGIQDINESVNLGVDDMQGLCVVKISFIKGFGCGFPRSSVKETPCWISIHLIRALQLLDQVMNL